MSDNTEQRDDSSKESNMIEYMLQQAGQHLLIKELVLQTLVRQMKEVGIEVDPTPNNMRMVNVRAEKAERQVESLKAIIKGMKSSESYSDPEGDDDKEGTYKTTLDPNSPLNPILQAQVDALKNMDDDDIDYTDISPTPPSASWHKPGQTVVSAGTLRPDKPEPHPSVKEVLKLNFNSPEAAHLAQEDEEHYFPRHKERNQPQPIQPIEADIHYDDDQEYED